VVMVEEGIRIDWN